MYANGAITVAVLSDIIIVVIPSLDIVKQRVGTISMSS